MVFDDAGDIGRIGHGIGQGLGKLKKPLLVFNVRVVIKHVPFGSVLGRIKNPDFNIV